MKTVGQHLADPNSNLSKKIRRAENGMRENEQRVAQWVAEGCTPEEAWGKLLAEQRARLFSRLDL